MYAYLKYGGKLRKNSKQSWKIVRNAGVSFYVFREKNYSMPLRILRKILAREGDVSTRIRILVGALSKLYHNYGHYGNINTC